MPKQSLSGGGYQFGSSKVTSTSSTNTGTSGTTRGKGTVVRPGGNVEEAQGNTVASYNLNTPDKVKIETVGATKPMSQKSVELAKRNAQIENIKQRQEQAKASAPTTYYGGYTPADPTKTMFFNDGARQGSPSTPAGYEVSYFVPTTQRGKLGYTVGYSTEQKPKQLSDYGIASYEKSPDWAYKHPLAYQNVRVFNAAQFDIGHTLLPSLPPPKEGQFMYKNKAIVYSAYEYARTKPITGVAVPALVGGVVGYGLQSASATTIVGSEATISLSPLVKGTTAIATGIYGGSVVAGYVTSPNKEKFVGEEAVRFSSFVGGASVGAKLAPNVILYKPTSPFFGKKGGVRFFRDTSTGDVGARIRTKGLKKEQGVKERTIRKNVFGDITISDKLLGRRGTLSTRYTGSAEISGQNFYTSKPRLAKLYPRGYGSQSVTRTSVSEEGVLLLTRSRVFKGYTSETKLIPQQRAITKPSRQLALIGEQPQRQLLIPKTQRRFLPYQEPAGTSTLKQMGTTQIKGFRPGTYGKIQFSIEQMKVKRSQELFFSNLPELSYSQGIGFVYKPSVSSYGFERYGTDYPQAYRQNPLSRYGRKSAIEGVSRESLRLTSESKSISIARPKSETIPSTTYRKTLFITQEPKVISTSSTRQKQILGITSANTAITTSYPTPSIVSEPSIITSIRNGM